MPGFTHFEKNQENLDEISPGSSAKFPVSLVYRVTLKVLKPKIDPICTGLSQKLIII